MHPLTNKEVDDGDEGDEEADDAAHSPTASALLIHYTHCSVKLQEYLKICFCLRNAKGTSIAMYDSVLRNSVL